MAGRDGGLGAVASQSAGQILFAPTLTRSDLTAGRAAGARITTVRADGALPSATDLLFLINPEGTLHPATTAGVPTPQPGDTLVLVTSAGTGTAN